MKDELNLLDQMDYEDDELKDIDKMEPGEEDLDVLTATDFNLQDTLKVPLVKGEKDA